MKQRLSPFLVLLEARYAPLLFAVAPQAYAVYLWLFPHPYDGWGELFAVIGAIGYEAVYVGAIAWAEEGKASRWTWLTAGAALIFSIAVAVYVYLPQGWWSALHAGFPLVAFCYTMQLHKMTTTPQGVPQDNPQPVASDPQPTPQAPATDPLTTLREEAQKLRAEGASWQTIATAVGRSPSTVREWLAVNHNGKDN